MVSYLGGTGRWPIHQGEGTLIPFSSSNIANIEIEPVVGEVNSAAAECLLLVFPDMEEWCVSLDGTQDYCSEHDDWVRVCQYPGVHRKERARCHAIRWW